LVVCPDDTCVVEVEVLTAAAAAARICWYCWRRRLTTTGFAVFEIVVGDWERWLIFDDIKFKCCIKFCRVKPDAFVVVVCSSPPAVVVNNDDDDNGSWKTIFAWDVFAVKPSAVGSINDDDLSFDDEPADEVDDDDEPDIVRAGTSTALGCSDVSFGSVLATLNDLIRCKWAARSGDISWSLFIVERGNDDVEVLARL
jgi:hypothetical protein